MVLSSKPQLRQPGRSSEHSLLLLPCFLVRFVGQRVLELLEDPKPKEQWNLFKEIVAEKEPDFWLPVLEEEKREEWKTVLKFLSSAIDGIFDPTGEDDLTSDQKGGGFVDDIGKQV